ncbi:MAG: tRNA A37 threonylcarbamoyladenosine synthetase subunit TsaC/SUA5/YrdC, partial [Maribacter sp.]
MLLKLYDNNTNPKDLKRISQCLQSGGVIIYPTDTIYAIGCDI